MRQLSSRAALWAFAALAVLLAFAGGEVMSLKGCDEGFYAQIAREMVQGGDWLTLHYGGTPNFEKPPLLFWLVASVFALGGIGDFQARLPVLVCGLLAIFGTVAIAWVMRRDARLAVMAGGVVATTGIFIQVWHQVMTDVPAYLVMALMALGLLGQERDRRFGWLVGPSLGLLILIKGALAALIVAACLPYLVWRRSRPDGPLLWGLVLGLVPAIAWYGGMHALHGAEFWRIHLGQQVLQRTQSGLFAKDPLGPAFYLVHMLGTFLPWSLLVPGALVAGWRRARAGDGIAVFSLGFFAIFLLAISLMQTKFEHYALPLLLPVALLTADWLKDPQHKADRWVGGGYLALSVGVAIALGVIKLGRVPLDVPQLDLTLFAVGLLAATFAGAGWSLMRRAPRLQVGTRLLLGAGLSFIVAAQFLHLWDAVPGMRQTAARLPANSAAYLVIPGGVREDFCTYGAMRFRVRGALDVLTPDEAANGPKGWYLGKSENLSPRPQDRLVAEAAGWRLLERP